MGEAYMAYFLCGMRAFEDRKFQVAMLALCDSIITWPLLHTFIPCYQNNAIVVYMSAAQFQR